MVCLGFKPGAAGWKAQTNPLRHPILTISYYFVCLNRLWRTLFLVVLSHVLILRNINIWTEPSGGINASEQKFVSSEPENFAMLLHTLARVKTTYE